MKGCEGFREDLPFCVRPSRSTCRVQEPSKVLCIKRAEMQQLATPHKLASPFIVFVSGGKRGLGPFGMSDLNWIVTGLREIEVGDPALSRMRKEAVRLCGWDSSKIQSGDAA